ncbi:hypothetical protein ANANG_G00112130 [Anguilla anguilla]|uniref:Uncharacterized protein n=1 Tax=Anguilla anguilla TaxID=7936 RepID=A0A9D3MIQ5_ANGAN|nr:hypothetical protein ANANG_G00112130 [Anguilla anguilla]
MTIPKAGEHFQPSALLDGQHQAVRHQQPQHKLHKVDDEMCGVSKSIETLHEHYEKETGLN